jgi:indolepyruvate ferredoxin oxidoreductase alpha subunit
MKNGYTSATGTQQTVSTPQSESRRVAEGASATGDEKMIENTLTGLGVQWIRTVHNYRVAKVKAALQAALGSSFKGLKVIIAEGECQLERQRRLRPIRAARLKQGLRCTRTRYGVDEDTCTGDHACIRLSGCPSLTIKAPSDPLKRQPVASVTPACVGCGMCGEVAHAAALCPSFYRVEVISHPRWWERASQRVQRWLIGLLQPG